MARPRSRRRRSCSLVPLNAQLQPRTGGTGVRSSRGRAGVFSARKEDGCRFVFSDGPGSFRATALHILLRYLDILSDLLTGGIVRNV
jgi:hypothetical protein